MTQTVTGSGYRFEAPAGWKVEQAKGISSAASGEVDRVEVRTFRLARPYQPHRFRAATRELDHNISRIAAQLEGQVTSRRTVVVDGRKARSYVVTYGDGLLEQITWVLEGRQEHQLLCRRAATGTDDPCRALIESFVFR